MEFEVEAEGLGVIKVSVTTITLIAQIKGVFNTSMVYGLLPISHAELTVKNKRKKMRVRASEVIKKDTEEGSIVSMRYGREVRGIRRDPKRAAFQNSITIDIFIGGGTVSVKLSRDKIQLCGATSDEQGHRAVEYLLSTIAKIQELITWKNANGTQTDFVYNRVIHDAWEWFHKGEPEKGCGPSTQAEGLTTELVVLSPEQLAPELVHKSWDEWSTIKMLSREIDAQLLYEFLSCRYEQYASFEVFMTDLGWFRKLTTITDDQLSVVSLARSMLNWKYNLGHLINLFDLKCYFHQLEGCNFFAHYDPAVEKFLIVERKGTVPYTIDYHRRKEMYFHTLMIYQSGIVTQSGLGNDEMQEAFYDFLKIIAGYLAQKSN